ncbi:MAG: signal peptidase I [Oscillospiraceae bacterium]|nr:signal peptidase I [Oscillospiraceae bacterium]
MIKSIHQINQEFFAEFNLVGFMAEPTTIPDEPAVDVTETRKWAGNETREDWKIEAEFWEHETGEETAEAWGDETEEETPKAWGEGEREETPATWEHETGEEASEAWGDETEQETPETWVDEKREETPVTWDNKIGEETSEAWVVEPEEETSVVWKNETAEVRTKETVKARGAKRVHNKVSKKVPLWKELLFLLMKVLLITVTFVLLSTFLFGFIRYQDPSMDPAIKDGDLVIFYRYIKDGYLPQDAVALEYKGHKQVRRVIATAGDEVDISEDGLMVNGALQQEPGIYQKTERYQDGVEFPLIVPEGHVFVLGDFRVDATDSRVYGCVEIEKTLGKVMTILRRRSI